MAIFYEINRNWLVISTPLKNMKVSWDDFPIYVPNHRPGNHYSSPSPFRGPHVERLQEPFALEAAGNAGFDDSTGTAVIPPLPFININHPLYWPI